MPAGSGPVPLGTPPIDSCDEPSNLVGLPFSRRELFADERGTGLRVSWHPERAVVVLSLWKDDACAGTFHLPSDEAPRLAAFLAGADRAAAGAEPAPTADATTPLQVLRGD